jgi:hypothetical protein
MPHNKDKQMKNYVMVLALGLLATGCIEGNGDIISEDRHIGEFDGVELSVGIDAHIETSDSYALSITCDSNLVSRIDTTVSNGTLEISADTWRGLDASGGCFVSIYAPAIQRVVTFASGDLFYDAAAPVAEFYARTSGSGTVSVTGIESDEVISITEGSGDIVLSGTTRDSRIRSEGSGDIWSRNLLTETAKATTNGSGELEVFASESVVARTNGSGDITIYGAPTSIDVDSNGSGDIRFE